MDKLTAAFAENLPLTGQETRAFALFCRYLQAGDGTVDLTDFFARFLPQNPPVGEVFPMLWRFGAFCSAMGRGEMAAALFALPVGLVDGAERLQAARLALAVVSFSALRPVRYKKWYEAAEFFAGPSLALKPLEGGHYLRLYLDGKVCTHLRKGDRLRLALDEGGAAVAVCGLRAGGKEEFL